MIWDLLLLVLLNLFGFSSDKPKHDLHKQQDTFKLNDGMIMLLIFVIGTIFFISIFFLIGSCTDSGLFYNSHLY